jgi:DNA polymerase-3 subunit beta
MKTTIKKENLLKAIQAVDGVVASKTAMPVLANLLIQASGSSLKITATNLDLMVSCEVPAAVEKEGSVTVSEFRLSAASREIIGDDVKIEVDENNVCCIKSGPSKYNLRGIASSEFPLFQAIVNPKKVSVDQSAIKKVFSQVMFAMSEEASRYVLCGTMIEADGKLIKAVAADGRRLALNSVDGEISERVKIIIPSKAAMVICRLLGDEGKAIAEFGDNSAKFTIGNVSVYTKLIEGAYPDINQIIPKSYSMKISVPREEFSGALRRVSIMTSEKWQSVKLVFTNNLLTITSNSPEVGDATESMELKYKEKDFSIAFNPKYITDALNALSDKDVSLEINDEISPLVIKNEGPFLYIVSPMRLA